MTFPLTKEESARALNERLAASQAPSALFREIVARESFMSELVQMICTAKRRGWPDEADGLTDVLGDAEMHYGLDCDAYEQRISSSFKRWERPKL